MADRFSKATRSGIMSKIRSKNTVPEILVRKYLHSQGYRFRLHDKKLPGKPDIVFIKIQNSRTGAGMLLAPARMQIFEPAQI